jgi:hypothetical protein
MRREESAPARAALGPALAMGAVLLLALVPFRVVFAHPLTTLLGTSNDSVHGTWSLWYLTDGGPADAFWPVGIVGTVIGGPSVLFGRAAAEAFGPVAAWSASCAAQTVVALLGVAALALRLGGGPWSAPGHVADTLGSADGWPYSGIAHPEFDGGGILFTYYRSTGDWTGEIHALRVVLGPRG